MRSEKEKMLAGELYDPLAPELVQARERARYSTIWPVGISPSPSQRCVAAIHDIGINTGIRANRLPMPRR
jgi:hypothetical protein